MTIKAKLWAKALHDVSPVAKLAAIYIADDLDETTGHPTPPLSVSDIAKFACATVSAVAASLDELAQVGVKIEHVDATKICARLPVRP